MCKAPKPPEPKEPDKPEFLRNAYLDAAIGQSGVVQSLRQGRSGFRLDLDNTGFDSGLGIASVAKTAASSPAGAPTAPIQPISRRPVSRRGEGRNALR